MHFADSPTTTRRDPAAPATLWRYFVATALIAIATGVGYFWTSLPDARNLALVFFGAVLFVGFWAGARPALYAALLAFFAYNFFLIEPRFTLHFSPADFLAFASFLIGALIVGGLSGRLSDRARDATNRLRDLTALFVASRDLAGAISTQDVARRAISHLEKYGCRAAIWLSDGPALRLAASSVLLTPQAQIVEARLAALLASQWVDDRGDECWLFRLEAGERALGGVAVWPPPGMARLNLDRRWITTLLELTAVGVDRGRLIAEVAETSIIAEKEGLRTALLSSLSHDLRTPIATILASTTALQDQADGFDETTRREMLEVIQEESERLNRYISNLLEMTRLDSGALDVHAALIDPGEAIASAVERVRARLKSRRVFRSFEARGRRISVDAVLMEQALMNVLENAIAHSPDTSTLYVRTGIDGRDVIITVEDEGPGIPAHDLDHVFDKFFRGRSDRRLGAGVGLGLSVTRGIIEAFGGQVRALSPNSHGVGACIEFRLPGFPAPETVE